MSYSARKNVMQYRLIEVLSRVYDLHKASQRDTISSVNMEVTQCS